MKFPIYRYDGCLLREYECCLDNKLVDFEWRLAHNVLYTNQRVAKWGKSDGVCPIHNCNDIESVSHIFWVCPKVSPIITWLDKILKSVLGHDFHLDYNYYMYGINPQVKSDVSRLVLDRVWVILSTTKFVIWKSRCIHVFQHRYIPSSTIMSNIVKDVNLRVKLDF